MPVSPAFNYLTYGTKTNGEGVTTLLRHALHAMIDTQRPTPLCIWGLHGIGKTELVRDFAQSNGLGFRYIAPAQFEEMGDLLGMPFVETHPEKGALTRFAPPEWVPLEEGPGIFLIDDVNRADDRILRGLMQLLQNYELAGWSMPKRWLIVLTANPDGGDYSVTPMDNALLTRMLHVTMIFEVKNWAAWATRKGIDARGIAFVLAYPELVTGKRTTPRSLEQFFEAIRSIEDLKQAQSLVKMLAEACLDVETAAAFLHFIHLDLDRLIAPETLLNAVDFEKIEAELHELSTGDIQRADLLSVIIQRLAHHIASMPDELSPQQTDNLRRLLLLDSLPGDLRFVLAQDLIAIHKESLKPLFVLPEIGRLLLEGR